MKLLSNNNKSDHHIALLGGSFNPPHLAHQMICLWALSTQRADEVWLVPSFEHPFQKPLVSFEHRCAMCALLAEPFQRDRVKVSDVEAKLPVPSRTLNTLEYLSQTYPTYGFSLIIGADILQETSKWYRFDEIKRLANILVIGRMGYSSPADDFMLPPISSTSIRKKFFKGHDVSQVIPASVLAYIQAHQLYGAATEKVK